MRDRRGTRSRVSAPTWLGGLAGVLLWVTALTGCGQEAPAGAPWRSSHPDPSGYAFLEQGQLGGVCAISVHYPDDAPSAISRAGTLYLQRGRSARGTAARENAVGRSGDWTLLSEPGGNLALLTASDRFEYEPKSTC